MGVEFKKGDKVLGGDFDNAPETAKEGRYLAYDDISGSPWRHIIVLADRSFFRCRHCRYQLPNLKMDDPVWVRDSEDHPWLPRHFKKWAPSGKICTWQSGRTSHSAQNTNPFHYSDWKYWKI